ncbi:MAG: two-component sensor histidine kinase [Planctomycetes bacterium]|nr:two-component sensor histidine kinase [Planctomycetota bacterium]
MSPATPSWQVDVAAVAGSLVHEIKNPLSTLQINAQLLLEEWKAPDTPREKRMVKRLQVMLDEVRHLEAIVRDFLRFAERHELERVTDDVNALIEGVADLLGTEMERRGIRLRASYDRTIPPLPCDRALLRQAVTNLLINAEQAMPEGGEVIIKTAKVGEEAVIDIIDTGVGIPPQNLQRIFALYFTTKKGGSGLGLATTKRIIEEHGGRIEVSSEIGKGTQFRLRLPLRADAPSDPDAGDGR